MAERLATWAPRSAWSGLPALSRHPSASGVFASPREGVALATVITRRGQDSALRSRFAALGVDAPGHPVLACGRGFDLVWAGPQQWLAMSGDRAMPAHLAVELEGLASVSDQSDGRAVVRLSGPKLRETLAKGCAIDLHPRAFRPGHTAITAIAHIGVQLWQHDEEPTFDLLVARSMAGSFWGWLSASAAEFGLALR